MCFCENCGAVNDEPDHVSYCKEDYNGVADQFGYSTYGTYASCPDCGSEEVKIIHCDDDCTDCVMVDRCDRKETNNYENS